jgi:hypothetical protein
MTFLPYKPAPFNRLSAANRAPNLDPLILDRDARQISGRYNVSPGMALIVAALVASAVVRP